MHQASLIAAAVGLCLFTAACREPAVQGNGPARTEQRPVTGTFRHIRVAAAIDARITPGSAPSVALSAPQDILPYIGTTVRNDTLFIDLKKKDHHLFFHKSPLATITLPELSSLAIDGSSDALINGRVTGPALSLAVYGSGSITADAIQVDALAVAVNGSGDITLSAGKATRAAFTIEGSGDIDAFGLEAAASSVAIDGSGNASVRATGTLSVGIEGSGDVAYKGHPTLTQSVAGSGDITDAN